RTIGCEKAQGFLIGKPEPLLVTRNNLEEKHYRFERLCLRQYYDDLGKVNFLSNQPLEYAAVSGRNLDVNQITDLDQGIPIAVWEMRGDIGRFLLTNRAYRDVLLSVGVQSPRAAEFDMNDREEQIYWSARQFFREMQEDGDIHAQYAVLGGHHCFIRGRVIARHHGRSAYLLVMQDLSGTFDIEQYKDQAEITNSLFRMFDYVFLLAERPDQDVLLYSVRELPTFSDMDDEGILHEVRKSLMVHPKDQDRYDDFFDRPAIHRALRDGDRAEMKGCFRFWDSSGSWCWKEISLSLSRVGDKKMLAGMRLQMLDMQSDISIGSFHPVSLKELQYLSQMKQTRDTNGHCL
ncbi:MAG: hypothetical protein LIV24_03635, partial [Eubacterium sp.]|nr:hypothetical protein [Eubacterium sp.]